MKDIYILGIETSCDETAASVVKNGRQILSNEINSQVKIHAQFGGVVPEVASRKHIENIALVVDQDFSDAGLEYADIDAIAVTNEPGLIGALLVGLSFAKGLAWALERPLLAVNHLHGHIYANILEHEDIEFPAVCLVVSGGHTNLLLMEDINNYQVLGASRDDAAGEAFDKVARFLGLGYPGGPAIQKAAQKGQAGKIKLPRVFLDRHDYEFSFSGLKTATMNMKKKMEQAGELQLWDLAAEFQQALIEVLVEKSLQAARQYEVKSVLMAGGVAANQQLRSLMEERAQSQNIKVFYPSLGLCTDNAAMIAGRAYHDYIRKSYAPWSLNAYPSLSSW
jgi:N6-L-threonylcarbamoyladenine synthase